MIEERNCVADISLRIPCINPIKKNHDLLSYYLKMRCLCELHIPDIIGEKDFNKWKSIVDSAIKFYKEKGEIPNIKI